MLLSVPLSLSLFVPLSLILFSSCHTPLTTLSLTHKIKNYCKAWSKTDGQSVVTSTVAIINNGYLYQVFTASNDDSGCWIFWRRLMVFRATLQICNQFLKGQEFRPLSLLNTIHCLRGSLGRFQKQFPFAAVNLSFVLDFYTFKNVFFKGGIVRWKPGKK